MERTVVVSGGTRGAPAFCRETARDLSASNLEYLRTIWAMAEWSSDPITPKDFRTALGVSPAATSEMVRKLASKGLLEHRPYGAIALTEAGRSAAAVVVRRYRLMKTFLVEELGYAWDELDAEAARLAAASSPMMIERIDAIMQSPTVDPHGESIPAADGSCAARPPSSRLDDVCPGSWLIQRVDGDNAEMLRYFGSIGVRPGAVLTVVSRILHVGLIEATVGGGPMIPFGLPAAQAVWVSDAGSACAESGRSTCHM